jgi:hypothetical protein
MIESILVLEVIFYFFLLFFLLRLGVPQAILLINIMATPSCGF